MGGLSAVLAALTSPLGRWIGAAALVGVLLIGAYWKGRTDQVDIHASAAAKELSRQVAINERQRETFRRLADTLAQQNTSLENRLDTLNDEARKAPGARTNRIDADSVQRIDRIH